MVVFQKGHGVNKVVVVVFFLVVWEELLCIGIRRDHA